MHYVCQKCKFKADSYESMRSHAKETGHAYTKRAVETLVLNEETKKKLVETYLEQMQFAHEITCDIIEEIKSLDDDNKEEEEEKNKELYRTLFPIILDKVLTPAVYVE